MSDAFRPTKRHERFANDIRALRECRGLTIDDALALPEIAFSSRTYRRIENAECLPNPMHVMLIADALSLPADERRILVSRATALGAPEWYDGYSLEAIGPNLRDYLADESEAIRVCSFAVDMVDGLLQPPDYMRAVLLADVPAPSPATLAERVAARLHRQARLTGPNPLILDTVVTEAALRLQVGGPRRMRALFAHLVSLADLPNVTIRVIPSDLGAYPGIGNASFWLLSLRSDTPDVAYLEPGIYTDDPPQVQHQTDVFDALCKAALPPAASLNLLRTLAAA